MKTRKNKLAGFTTWAPEKKLNYIYTYGKFDKQSALEIIRIIDRTQDWSEHLIPKDGQTEEEAWVDFYDEIMLNALNFLTIGDLLDYYSAFQKAVEKGFITPDGKEIAGKEADLWQFIIDISNCNGRGIVDYFEDAEGHVIAVYWFDRWNDKFTKNVG